MNNNTRLEKKPFHFFALLIMHMAKDVEDITFSNQTSKSDFFFISIIYLVCMLYFILILFLYNAFDDIIFSHTIIKQNEL